MTCKTRPRNSASSAGKRFLNVWLTNRISRRSLTIRRPSLRDSKTAFAPGRAIGDAALEFPLLLVNLFEGKPDAVRPLRAGNKKRRPAAARREMLLIIAAISRHGRTQSCHERRSCDEKRDRRRDQDPFHGLLLAESITEPANRLDVIAGLAELVAQAPHVRVDCSRVDDALVTPDVVKQTIAFLHSAPALNQRLQKFEFDAR